MSGLNPGLWPPLPTLHERRCRRPCKARFRLAGCAFAGRELNPLDRSERFQATSVLLPRTSPDASWAHGRRDFFKLAELAKAPVAIEAVQRIDAIFDVERTINGLPIEQRRAVRQAQIGALVDDLQGWMRDVRGKMSRHADVAKAIDYMLKRWPACHRFLDDGRICLTNNAAERALRGIALGRKAWLFAGSDRGGERAASMYSLIVTAKLNDVDPRAWLADVLTRISDHPASHLHELLPWNWRAAALKAAA
jgi:transposase